MDVDKKTQRNWDFPGIKNSNVDCLMQAPFHDQSLSPGLCFHEPVYACWEEKKCWSPGMLPFPAAEKAGYVDLFP